MKHNTNVKYNTLESFVSTINDLGIELIIDESLRNVRKEQLETLIDKALQNKNEQDFKRYTEEYKHLEEFLVV
ncbi:IDEAL domain-containing protein [Staphylococcus durrellii]|uniref:IDEAL domain-containing protein n=1 Tax=Staphylococcus durrellii TaxID=2781773 RepID=UPI00189D71D7|nr:IDEAL domain-containing protein [Staphylococcus durrellii]MBF7017470.1 IDEAL domain-containing protein [Staphylococcus durrellii]